MPLDLREATIDWANVSFRDLVDGLGDNTTGFFWFRALFDAAVGAGLLVVASRIDWSRERILRLAAAVAVAWSGWLLLALPFFLRGGEPRHVLLGVWLGPQKSHALRGFAGLGSNVSYFSQLAVLLLPWLVVVLVEKGAPRWARTVAAAGLAVGVPAVGATYLRNAWGLLVVLAAGSLWAWREVRAAGRGEDPLPGNWLRRTAIVVGGGLVALLVFTPLGANLLRRAEEAGHGGDWLRGHLLAVAGQMFLESPFLGIGNGRYAAWFSHYSPWPDLMFGTWSSHNLFAQFLAEQGIVGLATFVVVVAAALVPGIRARREVTRRQPAYPFLLIALAGFGLYSLSLHTLQVRAVAIVFWIVLGIAAAMASGAPPFPAVPRSWIVAMVALLVVTGGFRAARALTRPVEPGYESGFHSWSAGMERWTKGRAIRFVRVEGKTLLLPFANAASSRLGRQRVWVSLDGRLAAETWIESASWKTLEIPVNLRPGSVVAIEIECSPTFVPADLGIGNDQRLLGVQTKPAAWR